MSECLQIESNCNATTQPNVDYHRQNSITAHTCSYFAIAQLRLKLTT
jgi:hypothetical protein